MIRACCPTALISYSASVASHFIIQEFTIRTDKMYLRSAKLSILPLHTNGSIDSLMSYKIYPFQLYVLFCFSDKGVMGQAKHQMF